MLTRRSSGLDKLTDQLAQAISVRDQAALAVEQAETAKEALDGLDAAAWTMAEADLAAATSEHERCERAVATAYRACADEAERVALMPVERAEVELAKLHERISAAEAQVAALYAARGPVEVELEDALEALREVRVEYLDPSGADYKAHTQRETQRRERLAWHVRHPEQDDALNRRDRDEVIARREQLQREQVEAHERLIEQARAAGTLVSEGLDNLSRIER